MGLAWTILLVGLPLLGGAWGARHGLGQGGAVARLLASATLAWAWINAGMLLLGTAGHLARLPLLAWAAAGAVIGLGFRLRARRDAAGGERTAPRDAPRLEPEALLALGLALWAATIPGMASLVMPVKVVSDGPIYHLYFAARWWKAGQVFPVAAPFGENAATYFPAAGDLWFSYLMVGWGGDRLAKIGQAPFLLLAAAAAFGLARRLGARPSAAVIATTWFVTCAPFLSFSFDPNVDTIFVAGYLMAAYFLLRFAIGDDGWPSLLLGGLAAGGAWATKATATVFVPPLLALAGLAVLARRGGARTTLAGLATVALAPMVMAGYWFARNAWLTGNPLYPLQVEALGRTWLAGWYGPEVMTLSQYYIPRDDWRAFADILLTVLDPRLAPVWALALLGAWAVDRRRPARGWVWLAAVLAAANLAMYWLLIPYRTQQRFMFHALGLAVVPLARLLDLAPPLRLVGAALLAVHVFTHQGWPMAGPGAEPPWDLSPMIPNGVPGLIPAPTLSRQTLGIELVGLLVMGGVWAWARRARRPTRGRTLAALGASAVLAGALALAYGPGIREVDRMVPLGYPNFPDYYRGWLELERRSGPAGVRVAYAGTNIPYYLMGIGLRNEVRYVNVSGPPDWLLHDFHRSGVAAGRPNAPYPRADWDRIEPDFDAWLANLRAERIQLLVTTRVNPAEGPHNVNPADPEGFPIERAWADRHPEVFEPLYADPLFRLYRVGPPARP